MASPLAPSTALPPAPRRVLVVGGGFAGLYVARHLAGTAVDLTVVDRRNFHLFQPLLYQVATGALSPGEIAQPLRRWRRGSRRSRTRQRSAAESSSPSRRPSARRTRSAGPSG